MGGYDGDVLFENLELIRGNHHHQAEDRDPRPTKLADIAGSSGFPLVAVLLGWLILAEPVTMPTIIGGAVVVIAVAVVVEGRAR
jgi:hypothetical protein